MAIYILMGVSGSGKSSVGRKAAEQLNVLFLEGDDFHSDANIAKMSSGIALTDKDRMPWVEAMVNGCNDATSSLQPDNSSLILACSALSKNIRKQLRAGLIHPCHFIHLSGDQALLKKRLSERQRHFFNPELLASQFAALDIPRGAVTLNIVHSVDVLVRQLCEIIRSEDKA